MLRNEGVAFRREVGEVIIFIKQKTSYEITEGDWSSDVCSSVLTCKELGVKYSITPQSISSTITAFGRSIQKKLNRAKIIGIDGKEVFWIVVMQGKYLNNGLFEWKLRDELIKAMENLHLVEQLDNDSEGANKDNEIAFDFPFSTDYIEDVINWILPGLSFYYRDTNYDMDYDDIYKVGDVIRAGFFIDATKTPHKPTMNTRYIIASAHASKLFEVDDICINNPDIAKFKMVVFHLNSYFKVMDIYNIGSQRQIFLLHIPYQGLPLFTGNISFNFSILGKNEKALIHIARRNFDNSLKLEQNIEFNRAEWIDRINDPTGCNCDDVLMSLNWFIPSNPHLKSLMYSMMKLDGDDTQINVPRE